MGLAESPYVGLTWEGRSVEIDDIERELYRLWQEATSDNEGRQSPGRSKVLNLVVFGRTDTDLEAMQETVGRLSGRHPMRAMFLTAEPEHTQQALDTKIDTYCCQDPSTGTQLCCEQLSIRAKGDPARHLAGTVAPLLIPDLPTYLWWIGEPEYGSENFSHLLRSTKKLIIDSNSFPASADALRGIGRISDGRAQVCAVTDLSWERLSRWFEAVAQFFDNPRLQPHLAGIERVRVEYSNGDEEDSAPPTQAALLAGWLFSRLGKTPTHIEFRGSSEIEVACGRVTSFGIDTRSGDEAGVFEIQVKAGNPTHAIARAQIDGRTVLEHTVQVAPHEDVELLDISLESCQRDLSYEEAVGVAATLLERTITQ